ncbi:hypothetical protein Syun_018887 [Stephania yunnanensis]|uniref:Uncharacterized protein n=1 Tax=Stephania yunnanensis TaxID=152371 RepID=A0AAP0NXF4_9MAGN
MGMCSMVRQRSSSNGASILRGSIDVSMSSSSILPCPYLSPYIMVFVSARKHYVTLLVNLYKSYVVVVNELPRSPKNRRRSRRDQEEQARRQYAQETKRLRSTARSAAPDPNEYVVRDGETSEGIYFILGLRGNLFFEEGLDNVIARHSRLAKATRLHPRPECDADYLHSILESIARIEGNGVVNGHQNPSRFGWSNSRVRRQVQPNPIQETNVIQFVNIYVLNG